MKWLALALLVALGCEHAPRVAAPKKPERPWGVSYRRAGWSLMDPPHVAGDIVHFDGTRFALTDGRFLGFEPTSTAQADSPDRVRLATGELIAVIPKRCKQGRCSAPRLERWSGKARHVVADDFDAVALDASGHAALIVKEKRAFVLDTMSGALRWSVARLEQAWPQTMAIAPGGNVVALSETHRNGDALLRIFERRGSASQLAYQQPLEIPKHLAFHLGAGSLTLLVSGQDFAALRRGAKTSRPPLPYSPKLPSGFERVPRVAGEADLPQLWLLHERRGVRVLATGLERSELASAKGDRPWAALALRRLYGVASLALADPKRAFRVWRDSRGRHAELVIPACHEGGSNSDNYVRISELEAGVVAVTVIVPPGTAPSELLRTFVDEPLGPPPRERKLPALPARDCGV